MASRFDKDTIREYFEHCQRTGLKRINNIAALTEYAHKTGSTDEAIREWLFPDESEGPLVVCPTCGGAGRIPEPLPAPPEVCSICGGREKVLRFNFETRRDEEVPCLCVAGGPSTEEIERERSRLEEAKRRGAETLGQMLGVGELVAAILPTELKLVGKSSDGEAEG